MLSGDVQIWIARLLCNSSFRAQWCAVCIIDLSSLAIVCTSVGLRILHHLWRSVVTIDVHGVLMYLPLERVFAY